jgi:hypothetical protein
MSKPRNPRNPKGIGGGGVPGRRGRPVGSKPYYNPNQTQRYKSQALRYSKAIELANAGPDFVQTEDGQILTNDQVFGQGVYIFKLSDRILFRYASNRSPFDYWTVTAEFNEVEPTGPTDWEDPFDTEGLFGSPLSGGSFSGFQAPPLPLSRGPANATNMIRVRMTQIVTVTQVGGYYDTTNYTAEYVAGTGDYGSTGSETTLYSSVTSRDFSVNRSPYAITPPVSYSALTVDTVMSYLGYWNHVYGGYTVNFTLLPSAPDPDPVDRAAAAPQPFTYGGGAGGSWGGSTDQPGDDGEDPGDDEGEEGQDGEYNFACDCPDFTRFVDAQPRSRFDSEMVERDWSGSDAGADGDCKHIIATRLYVGLEVEAPIDYPL